MMEVFREKEGILALNRSMKAENKALKKENATLRLQLHAHANLETSKMRVMLKTKKLLRAFVEPNEFSKKADINNK